MRPRIQHFQRLEGGLAISYRQLSRTPRFVHSSSRRDVSATPIPTTSPVVTPQILARAETKISSSNLSRLPLSSVLRSYLITRMSSSPVLLSLCFIILQRMLDSKSILMSIERNPVVSKLLKSTFYAQFCAGETTKEVQTNTAVARQVLGYDGIILEYALEVLGGEKPTEAETAQEIATWRKGMLASIETASPGDFIGLKWSGLGRHALHLLQTQQPATPAMWEAITSACDMAAAKGVNLLPGAEEELTNMGLENWTLALQKKYNTLERGSAVVYTTYQCYLKNIASRLASHLVQAEREGFIAGVKLVRGAYLTFEDRDIIWETKEGTDKCYDACAESVLKGEWNAYVAPPTPIDPATQKFPQVNIVLATHNAPSIHNAQRIRAAQLLTVPASTLPKLAYAQLQGMADEISQSLVLDPGMQKDIQAKVVKCMAWGSTRECLHFLMRRASENKEAAGRTVDTRRAMGAELLRRVKGAFGFA